jgi:hypothetical protein
VYYFAIAATVAMLAVSADGCRSSSSIYPQSRVVVEPTKTDFGFIGTWRTVPTQNSPSIEINEDFSISMNADGVYKLESKTLVDFAITLRATELGKDSGYAIVDVDVVADEKHYCRYLMLAKRKDDELFVWWVESKNIAAKLHESGHSGVIEHGTFSTRVHTKPANLLDCVRKHSKELVGEPTRLKLVIK